MKYKYFARKLLDKQLNAYYYRFNMMLSPADRS